MAGLGQRDNCAGDVRAAHTDSSTRKQTLWRGRRASPLSGRTSTALPLRFAQLRRRTVVVEIRLPDYLTSSAAALAPPMFARVTGSPTGHTTTSAKEEPQLAAKDLTSSAAAVRSAASSSPLSRHRRRRRRRRCRRRRRSSVRVGGTGPGLL